MENKNVIEEKSFDFAVRIVSLYRYLCDDKREYILSKQLLRSGTSIGANVSEAQHGQSKADFASKMNIALKEANETLYWLKLLHKTDYITDNQFSSIEKDIKDIKNILIAICKKSFQ
jgi:TIGR02436 family protein